MSCNHFQVFLSAAIQEVQANIGGNFWDDSELSVVPLIALHAPLYCKEQFRFNLADNFMSNF
jgi:hypothetical protein